MLPGSSAKTPSYLAELDRIASTLPKSFGAIRQALAAKEGDPPPFTAQTSGSTTIVYFPNDITGIEGEALQCLSMIFRLCDLAGFEIRSTEKEEKPIRDILEATAKSVAGAFYCLVREEFVPTTNIPKGYESGWEYAQWYSFARATNDLDHGNYLSIPRVVNFLAVEGSAWNKGGKFTAYQRIATLIRLIAQQMHGKVKTVSNYLKGEAWFVAQYAGKKPQGSLLLQEELVLLTKEWEARVERIKTLYEGIDKNLKLPSIKGSFKEYMSKFNISLTSHAKAVEVASNQRIPYLLASTRKGRALTKTIVKGGNLPEKLQSPDLTDQKVRDVGKVLWSPLMGVTQNTFVDLAIRLARNRLHPRGESISEIEDSLEQHLVALNLTEAGFGVTRATLNIAASVYLEIYPDYAGNTSWDSAFGGFPSK